MTPPEPESPIPAVSAPPTVCACGGPRPDTSGLAFAALAALPRSLPLDARELGRLLGRHPKSVALAARRGELPPSFPLLGRKVWTAGAIMDFLSARQAAASREAEKFGKRA